MTLYLDAIDIEGDGMSITFNRCDRCDDLYEHAQGRIPLKGTLMLCPGCEEDYDEEIN